MADSYKLTASEVQAKIRSGELTVEDYAKSLLDRIAHRDPVVKAWAHIDREQVLARAHELDAIPPEQRGPLHGVAIGVKDVIYTKDMPTQMNSPIYANDAPALDAGSIVVLRHAGALLVGKTTTTEFASTLRGGATTNAHSPTRTPGGSSSGSGAAVGDCQVPVALGTQTGGSTIRPGSFNGVYAFKPTWGSVTREHQKIYSLILDTLGLYARSVEDLEMLADVFEIVDDEKPAVGTDAGVKGLKFASIKGWAWPNAGPGTVAAMEKAAELLRAHGAEVEEVQLPGEFASLPEWHRLVLHSDGRTAFLPEYRTSKERLSPFLVGHVENEHGITRAAQLAAFDGIGALRPRIDALAGQYAAVLTPSVPDEAPEGLESTGSAAFNSPWTALHVPVINVPGFKGENGLPIDVSLLAPRYKDRHLLTVAKEVGKIWETEGGWVRPINV